MDEPLGKVKVIPEFLVSPAALAFREQGVKVTPALSKKSVEFFTAEAEEHHTPYQRMIRRLLDACVDTQRTLLPPPRGRTEKRGVQGARPRGVWPPLARGNHLLG